VTGVWAMSGSLSLRRPAAVDTPSRRGSALAAAVATVLLLAIAPPPAHAQSAPSSCGPVVATSELEAGMAATGYTVSRGTQVETFDVEILGVLDDGIAPGRDMIIVDTDSEAIRAAGGIWAGMSGSPVYMDDRLVGAVAFGLSFGRSTIGGLTPAQDMLDVLELPAGVDPDSAAPTAPEAPGEDDIEPLADGALGRMVAEREGRAVRAGGETFQSITLPLAVSGLSSGRLALFGDAARDAGLRVLPYAASAATPAAALTPAEESPVPGGNFAGALSYGDLTTAAVGTTTLVCDEAAVAFGHPVNFAGSTTLGANLANAITIVNDAALPGFKLATIGGLVGTVDQDRLAGVRTVLGSVPSSVPITSEVIDLDLSKTRTGRTDVVFREALPTLAAFHTLANVDVTADRLGQGSTQVTYRVTGQGADAGAFAMARTNSFASEFDIAFESVFELIDHLTRLVSTKVDQVRIDSIEVDVRVEQAVRRYSVEALRVGVDGAEPEETVRIAAQPGSELTLEVDLRASDGSTDRTVTMQLVVPEDSGPVAFLSVGSALGGGDECLLDPAACEADGQTLAELIAELESAPRNDELVATLTSDLGGVQEDCTVTVLPDGSEVIECAEPAAPVEDSGAPEPVEVREQLDKVVQGQLGVELDLSGGGCPGCPPEVLRAAGEDRVGTAVAVSQLVFEQAGTVLIARADRYPDALTAAPLAAQLGGPVLLSGHDELPAAVAEEIGRLGADKAIVLGGESALGAGVVAGLEAAGIADVERIAGTDRYDTSAQIAARVLEQPDTDQTDTDQTDTDQPRGAYVAEGGNADPTRGWPDALSASGVAALEGRPVLLVESEHVPAATAAAIDDLGITQATVVGGPAAVSMAVGEALSAAGVQVDRVAGDDRYETSLAMAERAVAAGGSPASTWLATGRSYADALVAGAAAGSTGGVMVLLDGHDLDGSAPARQWLEGIAGSGPRLILLGGPAAISTTVEQQIEEVVGGPDGGAAG